MKKLRNLYFHLAGGCCLSQQIKSALRTKSECGKDVFDEWSETLSCIVYLIQISENLAERKTFKTSHKLLGYAIKTVFIKKSSYFN